MKNLNNEAMFETIKDMLLYMMVAGKNKKNLTVKETLPLIKEMISLIDFWQKRNKKTVAVKE